MKYLALIHNGEFKPYIELAMGMRMSAIYMEKKLKLGQRPFERYYLPELPEKSGFKFNINSLASPVVPALP